MNRSVYYKNLFFIGGIWNIAGSLLCWAGTVMFPAEFSGIFGMETPVVLFPYHAMYGLIIGYGIGYTIVSRDITKNHGIVFMGILGKCLFFLACLITVSSSQANLLLLPAGIGDLVFAALFVEFLLSEKKTEQIN